MTTEMGCDREEILPRERRVYLHAAERARQAYPGALGELIQRELLAFAEFGYRLAGDGLIERLAAEVLADARDDLPATPAGAGR